MSLTLTEEQRAIVGHDDGPALVFAVAGSGKTTAMIHRIERLVREKAFPASRILATSFNRAAVEELRRRLDVWPNCRPVRTRTLHSLGYYIIRQATKKHLIPKLKVEDATNVFYETLRLARTRDVDYREELDTIDREDFLSYVSSCKGNLAYANLAGAGLPEQARTIASQAKPPNGLGWYLDLYRLFEFVRGQKRQITFDDMLVGGWALMVKHPDLLKHVRGMFQCVLVDEFQDINLAQSEMLDLITAPHRNFMAIGDDDQTIYEWRGAAPTFILTFADRYDARTYKMTANFRSTQSQVMLANAVIKHNRKREPKQLRCTREAAGSSVLRVEPDADALGRSLVDEIETALGNSVSYDDIVVVVRLYAQTTYIEQHLIARDIPYTVVGSSPFYERPEVVTLLNYCRVAQFDRQLRDDTPLSDDQTPAFARAWSNIYCRPNRYISRALSEKVREIVVLRDVPVSRVLPLIAADAEHDSVADRMIEFAEDIRWLSRVLDSEPAYAILDALEARLDYKAFLRETSGVPETGAGKAANVAAFIDYACGKGTILDFMRHLEEISFGRTSGSDPEDAVELMTIFRAKGQEWEHVFVPDVNQGVLPFSGSENIEEERRLLYVAITRTKRHLHLYCLKDTSISQFFDEANYAQMLDAVHGTPTAYRHTKRRTMPAPKPSENSGRQTKERPSEFLQRLWSNR